MKLTKEEKKAKFIRACKERSMKIIIGDQSVVISNQLWKEYRKAFLNGELRKGKTSPEEALMALINQH